MKNWLILFFLTAVSTQHLISFVKEEKVYRKRLTNNNNKKNGTSSSSGRSKRHYSPGPLLNVGGRGATRSHPNYHDHENNEIDSDHHRGQDHNYHHPEEEQQHGGVAAGTEYLPDNFIVDEEGPENGPWSEWNYPSPCSRNCGGGVSTQTRTCRIEGGCQGPSKRFFSCNIQDCPDKSDFRAVQCSAFDSVHFEGRLYNWIPYTKTPNKCELNCMPQGERFYYRHKRKVTDGTRCNEEGNDLCVDGKCLPVGCDGLLGSTSKEDKCRVCGGDGSNCNTVKGIFDNNNLQVGYNDILLIPAGATNIVVREVVSSNNYLAIRNVTGHYYLNGNWRIDFPREVTFANTIFHYERKPHSFFAPESIRAIGPISEAIYIVVLYQESNPGIEYEYSVSKDGIITDNSENTYSWVYTDWSQCSAECGGGTQERTVSCSLWKGNGYEYVDNYLCDFTNKPDTIQRCNERIPCPIQWYIGSWESCSAPRCTNETGTQMRLVFCEQIVNGVSSRADDSLCEGPMPLRSQNCSYSGEICPTWFVGDFLNCSNLCGEGKQRRQVTCYSKDANGIHVLPDPYCVGEKPAEEIDCYEKPCDGLDWISSPWTGCAGKCGVTLESRKVHCTNAKGAIYDEKFCKTEKPEAVRDCEKVTPCVHSWYAVQWGDCSGSCGETGMRTRKVFCGVADGENVKKVEDSLCDEKKKYNDTEECAIECDEEVKSEWFSGPWQECSKKCGGGQRSRAVLCLHGNITDHTKCSEADILFTSEDCNSHACGGDELVVSPTVPMIEEDECDEEYDDYVTDGSGSGDSDMTTPLEEISSGEQTTMSSSGVSSGDEVTGVSDDDVSMATAPGDLSTSSGDGLSSLSPFSSTLDSLLTMTTGSGSGDDDLLRADLLSSASSDTTQEMMTTEDSSAASSAASASMMASTEKMAESSTLGLAVETTTEKEEMTTTMPPTTTEDMTTTTEDMTTTTEDSTTTTEESTTPEASTEKLTTESSTGGITKMTTSQQSVDYPTGGGSEVNPNYDDLPVPDAKLVDNNGTLDGSGSGDFSSGSGSGESPEEEESSTTEFGSTSEDSMSTGDSVTMMTSSGMMATTEEGVTGSGEVSTDVSMGSSPAISFTEASMTTTELAELEEEMKMKCKKTLKPDCKKAPFGCCPNGEDVATGPFAKGCPLAKTCKETTHGCCKDEVTPAKGKDFKGCPKVDCNKTLFGCCPDKETPKTDNSEEGCKKNCNETKWKCCPDEETPAKGKNYKGCKEIIINGKACFQTKNGCCPDGNNHAKGPNFKGCKEIDLKNCTKNHFGCCSDGKTSALDAPGTNCPEKCENELYGCCDDGKTSSHGPNKEGCCLLTEYGCCPDNIVPATDAIQSNCNCSYTPFGCCPDDKTAARGDNNFGCGCKFTEFGCCPDAYTEAKGRDNEGCACDTFQFGCCPDGVTVAKGTSKEGCGCESTEKGCCGDGKTPKGDDGECGCESSKFGCCPNGVSDALGEEFEGCQDIPIKPGDICGLDKERGSCRNFTVKWFFDMEYGGCSRFWYGGCDGNDNKFASQDECKGVCVEPEGRDACYLPKVNGPCEGYYPSWYYDPQRELCHQFIYGGCLGNNNRFPNRELCENTCLVSDRIDACDQVKTEGPCKGNYTRWFFDKESEKCKEFTYGGCKKNANNFLSEKECNQRCKTDGRVRALKGKKVKKCREKVKTGNCSNDTFYYDTNMKDCLKGCGHFSSKTDCQEECNEDALFKMGDACYLNKAEGACGEKLARWYYDINEQRCIPFYYTGCQGNNNRFTNIDECEKICPAALIAENTCQQPASVGDCASYTERFYYDVYEGKCKNFVYSGCGGNTNNYYTIDECRNKCENRAAPPVHQEVFSIGHCFMEPNEGSECEGQMTVRWYYDMRDGVCRQFRYTGCGGNQNSFDNSDECEEKCQPSQDLCQLPQVVGPCRGSFPQFYYDGDMDTCQQFTYGGCQGNGNRFDSITQCEQRCRKETPESNYIDPEEERAREEERRREESERRREEAERDRRRYEEELERESQRERDRGRYDDNRISEETTTVGYDESDLCSQRPERGSCTEDIQSWYFDIRTGRCQVFSYSGCQGNDNRFESEEQCERNCGAFRGIDVCNLPADIGPCRARTVKYYFDSSERACRVFTYGGCQGNGNRFSSLEECESVCFERNEVLPDNLNRSISGAAICKQRVDVGPCRDGYKRWYYDSAQRTCIPFVYGGCAGNLNRFKNFDICISFCSSAQGLQSDSSNYLVEEETADCEAEESYCRQLRCPYGIESWQDRCIGCQCRDVCRETTCSPDTLCAVDIYYEDVAGHSNGESPSFRPICRPVNKTGICPVMSGHTKNCIEECATDADCSENLKCCRTSCGSNCLPPISNQDGARIISEDNVIVAAEGGLVSLECNARGYPEPQIIWSRNGEKISGDSGRMRIQEDNTLQIVGVYKTDEGEYTCTASNVHSTDTLQFTVSIQEDPPASQATILEHANPDIVARLNEPANIRCFAIGWPRPSITWWRGETMLPFSSEKYQQLRDYSLLIRVLTVRELGGYTCQAYNGMGRAASYTVYVFGEGEADYSSLTEADADLLQYVIGGRRDVTRVVAPPPPPRQPDHLPPTSTTERRYSVALRAEIGTDKTKYNQGDEIRLDCKTEGYPPPEVSWLRDDVKLYSDDKILVTETNSIVISNATVTDSGVYTCKAVNDYTIASDTLEISVEALHLHENCTDNPFFANCKLIVKATYCTNKYYARFCCKSCTLAGQLPSFGPHLQEYGQAYFKRPATEYVTRRRIQSQHLESKLS